MLLLRHLHLPGRLDLGLGLVPRHALLVTSPKSTGHVPQERGSNFYSRLVDEEGEGGGNRRRRQAQAGKIICLFARSLCWRCRMDAELLSAHVVASYNEIL